MDILEALKLIVARSPNAAEEAIRTIAAARNNSPILQVRYLNTLQRALADPQATFSADERETLAAGIDLPESEGRVQTLRIRLTGSEYAALGDASDEAGLTMSEYARRKIFG